MPFGAETTFFGLLDEPVKLGVADVNVGVLVVFAVTSMGVYGIVLAGWASNSKYSLFGGLRASAQMISYELSYATALAAVILLAGSMSLREVVDAQAGTGSGFIPKWYVFLQPVGFIIYMIAGVAETNRAPFDFPEAEQELVAGFNTEYSSVRFALFPQAEYINMVTMSAVATDLYLGGWHLPVVPDAGWAGSCSSARSALILFFYIWVRWTLPRYRYDQLMYVRLEVAVPGVGHQPARHGGGGAVFQCLRRWSFYVLSGLAVVASALVIGQRNPMYSVMLLIASFAGAGRALHPARRAVRGGGADHHLRRRHHGAVPVRRHAAQRAAGGRGRVGPHASAAPAGRRARSARCWRRCSSCSWRGR